MPQQEERAQVPHLTCREIQAPLVSALIRGFAEEIGEEAAHAIAREVIRKDAVDSGRSLAERYGDNSLETLLRAVDEVWAVDETMEIANVELTDRTLDFDVTFCGYAEMYERLGIRELGCLMSCERDFPFMDGFNPEIRLKRSRTIMEGADRCDFRYERM